MNSRRITADEIRNLSLAEKISMVENILDSTVKENEYSEMIRSLYAKEKRRIVSYHPRTSDEKINDNSVMISAERRHIREMERIAALEMIGRVSYENLFETLDGEDFENCV